MDINELRQRKHKLESDIRQTVSILVKEFRKDTNISPYSIGIMMTDVSEVDKTEPEYILEKCHVSIEI